MRSATLADTSPGGDAIVVSEPYDGTRLSPAYDNNGNFTDDGVFHNTYDAWNRLVKVEHTGQTNYDRVTVALPTCDGTGRRVAQTPVEGTGQPALTQVLPFRTM